MKRLLLFLSLTPSVAFCGLKVCGGVNEADSPTWTGTHTFNGRVVVPFVCNGFIAWQINRKGGTGSQTVFCGFGG